MSALPAYAAHRPIYTLEEFLGGDYPETQRRNANCDVLADLVAHLCLQRPDLDLNGLRWFFADATGPDWQRIIGSRYPFDTLRVCTNIANFILAKRRLYGPRVATGAGPGAGA